MMKKTLMSLAITASVAMTAVSAHAAFLPFTIDETQLGVGSYVTTNVGKLNGGYNEVITINPDFTFAATAFATFSQLFYTNGNAVPTFGALKNTNLAQSYGMYAVFNSTGVVSGPTSFTGLAGVFDLYLDLNGDAAANFGATGATGVTVTGAAGDIKLASSTNLTYALGQGVGTPVTAFKFLFDDMVLTTDGAKYFVSPNPFYLLVNVNGDFDNGLNATTPGTYANVTGDVSAQFETPEPGSLALLGLSLAGLGVIQRRRKITK
jgi:hypothetical protein